MAGIIVGVDGSESAANALRWAYAEAQIRDTSLTAKSSTTHTSQSPSSPPTTPA